MRREERIGADAGFPAYVKNSSLLSKLLIANASLGVEVSVESFSSRP